MTWDGPRLRFREQSPLSVMIKQNRLDPTLGFFWGIVFIHVIFWTVLSYKTQPNVPQRTLELLTAGRELAWGYENQPPLSVWVTSVVGKIAAPRVWPLYMLAQLCGVVSVWAAWILARKFLHPWTALCGAIVLLGGYSCTIAASEFTSAHLASAFWSLSILSFHEALSESRRRYWAATGILLALGFLTSYGTLLLLITMFLFTIWNDHARRCWDSSWPFLAGLMMGAVMMPHLIWLVQHDFITVQSHLAPASSVVHHLEQPLAYLGTQLLCLIPVILLLTPLVAWFSFEEPASPQSEERNFARHYLLSMTCIPPVIIFTLALLAGPASSLFAGVTNWTFLGIALLLWGHLNETRLSWRRSLLRIGSAVGFFAAGLIAINLMLPHLSRQAFNTHFPGKELARGVEQAWRNAGNTGPVPVIAGPEKLVRNAAWNSKNSSRVALFENLTPASAQTALDTKLMEQGGVILWDNSDPSSPIGQQYVQRYGRVSLTAPQTLRWRGIADLPELNVGMAVVHPLLAQVTPQPTFPVANTYPVVNTVPENVLPMNYPKASTVPSYTNQTPLPLSGN
ncbi:MAG TPA: glycosyltransferase family 39 protein, partial [Planctomicrobium sp.]|nr:glycosyltransferase family 39 protein [Planctomicrobium sp.]